MSIKDRWSLIPWDAVRAVVRCLSFGSDSHGDQHINMTRRSWSGEWDAAQRHLAKWHLLEGLDEQSRMSHLIHAAARILILIAMELRGVGDDDRSPFACRPLDRKPNPEWVPDRHSIIKRGAER